MIFTNDKSNIDTIQKHTLPFFNLLINTLITEPY